MSDSTASRLLEWLVWPARAVSVLFGLAMVMGFLMFPIADHSWLRIVAFGVGVPTVLVAPWIPDRMLRRSKRIRSGTVGALAATILAVAAFAATDFDPNYPKFTPLAYFVAMIAVLGVLAVRTSRVR